jgi:hypothetical protein
MTSRIDTAYLVREPEPGISEHVSGKNFQGTGNFSREPAHSITSSAKTSGSGGMREEARWFRPSV